MAGHSKWSKIKRKKGVSDAKKGKIFTRCIYEITVAVKEGGGADPSGNPRLRFAIEKARAANMPMENIDRALKRASGEGKADEQVELTYEGYGPGGTAVIVDVLTDNRNRTVGELRFAFSRCGGTLGENGCVSWMFTKKGLLAIDRTLITEDELFTLALDAGAEDVTLADDVWEVTTDPKDFFQVRERISARVACEAAEIQRIPGSRIALEGKDAEQMIRMIDMLEDIDDVLDVATNCDLPAEEE